MASLASPVREKPWWLPRPSLLLNSSRSATRSSSSPGSGVAADQTDAAFAAAGIRATDTDEVWASDVVIKVNAPSADDEVGQLRPGATIVTLMAPGRNRELLEQLQAQRVTGLAMDAVPRISRAQAMDVLSSMANVAGYRAVIEAVHEFGRQFTRPGHSRRLSSTRRGDETACLLGEEGSFPIPITRAARGHQVSAGRRLGGLW